MMPAAKHGDPQLGVDVHLCVVPPSPSPVPLPTPHMSVVFDPMDYLPFIGATVTVCGMKRAVAGTSGQAVHIPPGFPFAPKLPDKDDELFMGSATVEADGDPFSFLGVPVLACQAVGMPSPPRPRRKGGPRVMMLPTVFNLAIPTNVFVGGPPTISLMGMAFKAGLAGLGKLARSNFARAIGARFQAWRKAKFGHLKPGFLKCKILRAEPVNIVTGAVSVTQVDFTLPGLIPIRWTRRYASDNPRRGACGVGWETPADVRLEHDAESGVVLFRDPEGEIAIFPAMPAEQGEAGAVLELMDGARLTDHGGEFRVGTKEDRLYRFPKAMATPATGGMEYPLGEIRDLCGNTLVYERQGGVLIAIRESAGRRIVIENGPDGLIRCVGLEVPESGVRHSFVTYEHDAAGDLVAVRDALGNPYRFAYDRHHMLRHIDRNGLSFHYEYDKTGEAWRVLRAWGDGGLYAYRFAYLDAVNERRITDSLGHVSVITLDDRGLPISEVDPLGGRTVFEYDDAGRCSAMVDPDGHRTEYAFDERGNQTRMTRPDGAVLETSYDVNDRAIAHTDASGGIWRQAFDARGLLRSHASPLGLESRYRYDAQGRRIASIAPGGAETSFGYDRYGNLVRVVAPDGAVAEYRHDALGNLTAKTDAAGHEWVHRFDAKGRIVEALRPGGGQVAFLYDAADNMIAMRDERGGVTRLEFTGVGEPHRRISPDGRVVRYAYDTEERLVAITNEAGQVFHIRRDALGRVTEEVDFLGQVRRYTYSPAGRLLTATDPDGSVTRLDTDPSGRILKKSVFTETDVAPVVESFAYDGDGRLIACENGAIRIERSYDLDGRLVSERQGEAIAVAYRYGANGLPEARRTEIRLSGALVAESEVGFSHDAMDRTTMLRFGDQQPIHLLRDAIGRVTELRLGAIPYRRIGYGPDGRVAEQRGLAGTRELFRQRYSYDPCGDLVERQDTQFGVDSYRYDSVGTLLGHRDPTGSVHEYAAGPTGTRLDLHRSADDGAAGHGRSARWQARLGDVSYGFDAVGRMIDCVRPNGDIRLTWDAFGRMAASAAGAVTTTYAYDALGRRIAKRTGRTITHFVWSGDLLIGELREPLGADGAASAPAVWREWIHEPGSFVPVAVVETDPALPGARTMRLFHTEPNGCPTRLVEPGGGVVWAARHDAWGRATPEIGAASDNPLRLQGQYADEETGLAYTRHRYYDPHSGQFVSQDPIGLAAGNNLYLFAPNVFGWIDPYGLQPNKGAMPAEFYDNIYRRVTRDDIRPADDFISPRTGQVLTAHPDAHSMPRSVQSNVLNDWEHFFTGVNYNGRPVDVYFRDQAVVITHAGDKTQVITAYGKGYGSPENLSRWRPEGWRPGERYTHWNRNKLRPCR